MHTKTNGNQIHENKHRLHFGSYAKYTIAATIATTIGVTRGPLLSDEVDLVVPLCARRAMQISPQTPHEISEISVKLTSCGGDQKICAVTIYMSCFTF